MNKAYKDINRLFVLFAIYLMSIRTAYASPLQGGVGSECIDTAIGCIPVSSGDNFAGFLLRWGIGIAGGIALILIVYSCIQVITAGGDPKKIQSGKELLTAAVSGFIFLLLSVFILQLVGVEILQIPGF